MRETLLHTAVRIANEAHDGQVRFAGTPFIEHPLRVMANATQWEYADEITLAAAVLHDVLEDGDPDVYDRGMLAYHTSTYVADLVVALTRQDGEAYEQYVTRIIHAGHEAVAIKIADLQDNMGASGLPEDKLLWHARRVRDIYFPAADRLSAAMAHPAGSTDRELGL